MVSHLPADDDASSRRRLVQEDCPAHTAVAGGHQVDAGKAIVNFFAVIRGKTLVCF